MRHGVGPVNTPLAPSEGRHRLGSCRADGADIRDCCAPECRHPESAWGAHAERTGTKPVGINIRIRPSGVECRGDRRTLGVLARRAKPPKNTVSYRAEGEGVLL